MLPVRRKDRGPRRDFPLSSVGDFDSLLDCFWNWSLPSTLSAAFEVDIWDDPEHVYVEAELPGINKDDINISIEGGVLSIQGKKKAKEEKKDKGVRLLERYYGSFSRSFTLPSTVDTEKVEAILKDGVFHIVLNKTEKAKAKQIEVNTG